MTVAALPTAVAPARLDLDRLRGPLRILVAFTTALVGFGFVMLLKGVNPLVAYKDMVTSTFSSWEAVGDILVRSTPVMLAALAVAVPARAGLINVGGEGQLLIGGICAYGVSLMVGDDVPGSVVLVLMGIGAALGGAAWSLLAGVLRQYSGISESVSTLLMNYIALDLMYFLIYDKWKDTAGSGQPTTAALPDDEHLPFIGMGRLHAGIIIALVAAVLIAVVFATTTWGFRLRVVGGNAEAARRSGLRVGLLLLSAMAVGGALAGLGGFVHLAGAEYKLRPGFLFGFGYVGFLASWLGRHRPLYVVAASAFLGAIVVGGVSLQIDSGLPAASVNILMALTLLMVLGFGRRKVAAR